MAGRRIPCFCAQTIYYKQATVYEVSHANRAYEMMFGSARTLMTGIVLATQRLVAQQSHQFDASVFMGDPDPRVEISVAFTNFWCRHPSFYKLKY
jgi:hypothetical protein